MCKVLTPEPGQRWLKLNSGHTYEVIGVFNDFLSNQNYVACLSITTGKKVGFFEEYFINSAKEQKALLSTTCRVGCSGCERKGGSNG